MISNELNHESENESGVREVADESVAQNPPSEKKRSRLSLIINIVVSVLVLAACLFGYTLLGERKRPERSRPTKSPVTIVATEPMQLHNGPVPITAHGVIVPLREIRLASEVTGRVIEQSENLRPGRLVGAGEVLVRLDPTEFELEVRRWQALATQETSEISAADVGIENAKQLSELAKKQVEIAESDVERYNWLAQQEATSAAEVDVARLAELNAKSALVVLENRSRELVAQRQLIVDKQALTKVELELAELNLDRCVVKSPVEGIVVASTVEEQSFLSMGVPFVTIEDSSAVEVRVNLTSDQMVWVWSSPERDNESVRAAGRVPQVTATITRSFGNDIFSWQAQLERVDGAGIDVATRTYPCLFRVSDPIASQVGAGTRRLTRGMFVDVTIHSEPKRTLHEISESAIRPGNRVWLNVGGKLRIAQATVVSRVDNSLIVELPRDFQPSLASVSVITSPISDPIDGMPVQPEEGQSSELSHEQPTESATQSVAKVAQ